MNWTGENDIWGMEPTPSHCNNGFWREEFFLLLSLNPNNNNNSIMGIIPEMEAYL